MTKEDLSKLIDECCDDIFDRKEPLANVKARLYYTLKKQLTLTDVVKSLPSIVEINFDGNLKCQIETTDKSLTVLKAVNGYGNSVDCNKDKTIITRI
jgi:hypothetical protein